MTLATDILALVRERDDLAARLAQADERQRDVALFMYRRGYLTGRASQRRGEPAALNPERHARGEARRLIG